MKPHVSRTLLPEVFIVLAGMLATTSLHADNDAGFAATVTFRSGDTVRAAHLGRIEDVETYYLQGKLGAQEFKIRLCEISEVIFADKTHKYSSSTAEDGRGALVIVSREGKRFTVTEARIYTGNASGGSISYVYHDPVTNTLKETRARIAKNVASIQVGNAVGRVKINLRTKEYFPASFEYDPYTGTKLEWADRE